MPETPPKPSPLQDPLGETLHLLRLTGTLYCRAELTGPWGIDLPAFEGCMMFHIITEGQCYLELCDEPSVLLRRGDLVLIPHGTGHRVISDPDAFATPLFDIPVEKVSERYEIMRHGGGGNFTHLTCGVLRFDHHAAQRLIKLLPKVMHTEAWSEAPDGWLQSTIRFISQEAQALRPGGETVITRLADILVIQAIRNWINTAPGAEQGWLAALRDQQIGRALAAIHQAPQRRWSVAELAKTAAMSRSAFSARFSQLLDQSPMRYLTEWRLQLARLRIQQSTDSLYQISHEVGYESESAFCRAFKRLYQHSPGSLRVVVSSPGNPHHFD